MVVLQNDDCVRIQPGLGLRDGCGRPVSKTAASSFETTRTELNRDPARPT